MTEIFGNVNIYWHAVLHGAVYISAACIVVFGLWGVWDLFRSLIRLLLGIK